jgi:putative ABC transport system substrate-binding protein
MGEKIFNWLLATFLLTTVSIAAAQQTKKVPRIGYLLSDSASYSTRTDAFRRALRELGYIEGHNIFIEYRSAEGQLDRLSGLAAELVQRKVAVIVTGASNQSRQERYQFDPDRHDQYW